MRSRSVPVLLSSALLLLGCADAPREAGGDVVTSGDDGSSGDDPTDDGGGTTGDDDGGTTGDDDDDDSGGTTDGEQTTPARWPMFHGNLANTGFQPGQGDVAGGAPAWASPVGLGESSPTVGQCDQDEALEIVTFTYGGRMVGLDDDGSERFAIELSGGGVEISTPSLADLDGDGLDEALVGSNVDPGAGGHRLYARHCSDGGALWTFEAGLRVMASPVVADLGAGPVVLIRPEGGSLHALDGATGSPLWSYPGASGSHGSVAVADVDGDGTPEIVVGSYFDGAVLDANGSPRCTFVAGFTSTPAVADVDADGAMEVVVSAPGQGVFTFDGATCQPELSIPWPDGPLGWASSPAVAQLDADPALEIVATNGKGDDAAYAYDGASGALQWRFAAEPKGPSILDMEASPVIADLDGDGAPEVVLRSYNGMLYVLGADGTVEWTHDFASEGKSGNVASTPAVADVDADGRLELVVQEATGKVYLFD